MNITSFSPLSLFLLMVLWVLRCRNAYKYHQLFSSLSPPSGDFLGLVVTQCLGISSAVLLSLSSFWRFSKSCGGAMLRNIVSCSLSLLLLRICFSPLSLLITIGWLYIYLICWLVVLGDTASRYPLITLLPVDMHSLGIYLLSYRDFYMFSYRTVGMNSDGNCSPCLLSPTAPAPCTRCIGSQVARFARPFESRPADPVRREVFRQLAANCGTKSMFGWVAPTTTLLTTPPPLERGMEERASRIVPSKSKRKRSS